MNVNRILLEIETDWSLSEDQVAVLAERLQQRLDEPTVREAVFKDLLDDVLSPGEDTTEVMDIRVSPADTAIG